MTEPQTNMKKQKVNKLENRASELDSLIVESKGRRRKKNELYLFSCEVSAFENIFISSNKRNLDTVVVIGQLGITSLNGISELINLRELWVVECLLNDLSDLEECEKLEKLYLYSNNIDRVPNMSKSTELKLFSLSGNKVSQLENFHSMPKLQELYIANNRIKIIGNAFLENSYLSVINLSRNNLYKLKDIKNLSWLSNLRDIVFADPMYGECPLVSLCNYRYFAINYLSSLIELDHYPVTTEERSYATEFFKSKTMFYEMQCNKLRNQYTKSLKDHLEENRQRNSDYRKAIYFAKLEQLRISRSDNVGLKSRELISHEVLQKINNRVDVNNAAEKQWLENAKINLQISQKQISLKAQHCGNINFIEYVPDASGNTLLKICQDICNESLCRTVKEDLGIVSVDVHRVTKVVNNETEAYRLTRYFNDNTNHNHKGSDHTFKFLVEPVGVVELGKWPFEIFEQEFFDSVIDVKTEIITTNCLAAADADWIRKISLKQKCSPKFLNSSNEHRITILVQLPISIQTTMVENADNYHAIHSDYDKESCQCLSIVKPEQVKPVFVVEYEYVFQKGLQNDVAERCPCIKTASANPFDTWPRMSIENLERCLKLTEIDVHKLQIIDLSGRGICVIDLSVSLPNLRELYLSYNKLTAMPNSVMLKYVRKLDVSFNDIRSFEIVLCLPVLESLNFSWNLAVEFFLILKTLEIFTPNLKTLDLKYNPFTDVTDSGSMSFLVQNAMSSLQCFNEIILENSVHSRPVNRYPWTVNMFENVELVKLDKSNESLTSSSSIAGKESENVEYLNLSDNYLSRVELIREFNQLRELHLANNLLAKFSLEKSVDQLTKLNLSSNFIKEIDGLTQENLPVVDYLDLCDNLITSLVVMGAFNSLTQFYCSHNKINKLQEIFNLKNWQGLKIIDLSNNPFDSIGLCNKFIIFHVPKIEYVSGECVTTSDILEANHTFGGSLDKDTIMNMCNVRDLTNLKQLSLVNCAIKKVNLTADLLPNLESLDLSKNQITTLQGLHALRKLRVLCLTSNEVKTSAQFCRKDFVLTESSFPSLNTLFLDHNGIQTLVDLNFANMPELKYLYLQHNELQDVDGLQKCANLETLVLDHNNIQIITEENFHIDNNMKSLFLENNKIKFLSFTKRLTKINKLFLSNNKVADKEQLKYLGNSEQLKEITILGNPLCKRTNHFKFTLQAIGTLTHIDGHSVILEEYLNT